MPILKMKAEGAEVRKLQLLLSRAMPELPPLKPDGKFGTRTRDAVMLFQKKNRLEMDGEVGEHTWAKLGHLAASKKAKAHKDAKLPDPPLVAIPPAQPSSQPHKSWLEIADAELGVQEIKGAKHTPRIIEYHATTGLKATSDEVAWCSSFVNWVVKQSGRKGTNSAAAKSWLDWGAKVEKPKPGCIVVIKKKTPGFTKATGSTSGYHVGFYVGMTEKHIRILGGNQSDKVKYSEFGLKTYEVQGYRV